MRALWIVAAHLCASLIIGQAEAANNGIYVGGSVSRSSADVDFVVPDTYDAEDSGFKLIAGVRPFDWFAVEVSYLDLGDVVQRIQIPDNSNLQQEQTGIDAFGVFFHEFAIIDLFVKAGLVKWDVDGSFTSFVGPTDVSDDGTDFAWGLGVQGSVGNIAVRVEYERFNFDSFFGIIDEPELISLGFTWTF